MVDNEQLARNLKSKSSKVPLFAQKVINAMGGFKDYAVSYDNVVQCKRAEEFAKSLGVVLNDGEQLDPTAKTQSCHGKVSMCFAYLTSSLKSDGGKSLAKCFYIDDIQNSNINAREFTDFCIWINNWLPNWISGMKWNHSLNHMLDFYLEETTYSH